MSSDAPEVGGCKTPIRRLGLEQEFFVVDEDGLLCNQADHFLMWCRYEAELAGMDPGGFKDECVKSLVEVATPPCHTLEDLSREYLEYLYLALKVAGSLGLRLYPLGTYPLAVTPTIRNEQRYRIKARILGHQRFMHAGRCAGTHLHLELPAGTVFPDLKVALNASEATQRELLDTYNLATALDPALVALTRSCPFYQGEVMGLAVRTIRYRGIAGFEGLYANIPEVGTLQPYAHSVLELIEQERERYRAWFKAMDRVGVERRLFIRSGGNRHRASWNPVRLNHVGTVEIRTMDSNYPQTILASCALVSGAVERLRKEGLEVRPTPEVRTLEVEHDVLLVPDFSYVSEELLHTSIHEGVQAPAIAAYLDSVVRFAEPYVSPAHLAYLRSSTGSYESTEAEMVRAFAPGMAYVAEEQGLQLVREACERLKAEICALREGGSVEQQEQMPDEGDLVPG